MAFGCAHARSPQPFSTPFHVIAHRGASAYAPENTLPAFLIARELGAYEVELDVMLSSDDVVMLFHDKEMDEKTNRTGVARDYTAEVEIAERCGIPAVVTLHDVYTSCPRPTRAST